MRIADYFGGNDLAERAHKEIRRGFEKLLKKAKLKEVKKRLYYKKSGYIIVIKNGDLQ